MKRSLAALITAFLICIMAGCAPKVSTAPICATTLPVYDLTSAICRDTPLRVDLLISEQVSCLHDYTLSVNQVRAAEAAECIVLSGAGLEDFMEDILRGKASIDSSEGIPLLCEDHDHEEPDDHHHHHEEDPHIWLNPRNAAVMAENICCGLSARYPAYRDIFRRNSDSLLEQLRTLDEYGAETLKSLSCREMITFHDGFAYFAEAYGLTILDSVEEESGSEASAKELIHLIRLTEEHHLPALFVEKNGSPSAASVIAAETGTRILTLDMAMSGSGYFDAMYHNINTVKEAMG